MEPNKEYENISRNALLAAKEDTFALEYQESLPQYCEDIEQVIQCSCHNVVNDYEYLGGTLKIYGRSRITIVYLSVSKCYLSAEFEETFTKNIDAPMTDNFAFASIHECTRFTNFRLINQRKIEIRTSVQVHSRMYERITDTALISCNNIIARKEQMKTLDVLSAATTSCDFDEEFSVTQHNGDISVIIDTSSYAVLDEMRLIKDKMLLKCRLELCVLYSNSEGTIEKCCFSVNTTKIVDIDGIDEESAAFAVAKTASLFVKAVPDNENRMRKLEIAGSISVSYAAAVEAEHELVTDAYAVDYKTDNHCETMVMNCDPTFYGDCKTLISTLNFEDEVMTEVLDLSLSLQSATVCDGRVTFAFFYSVLYYDVNGNICCKDGITESSIDIDANGDGIAGASLLSFDYIMHAANSVEFRINVEYKVCAFNKKEITYLKDIELQQEEEFESPVLTIYFASESETVWDIAKKFRTQSSLIMKENELTSDEIKNRRILLIPGV